MYNHTTYRGPHNGPKIALIICVAVLAIWALLRADFFPMLIYVLGALAFGILCASLVFYAIDCVEKH